MVSSKRFSSFFFHAALLLIAFWNFSMAMLGLVVRDGPDEEEQEVRPMRD